MTGKKRRNGSVGKRHLRTTSFILGMMSEALGADCVSMYESMARSDEDRQLVLEEGREGALSALKARANEVKRIKRRR